METLTKKEEEFMQLLWKLKKGTIRDLIDQMPEPKPPYTSVATIIRVLEKKGVIGYKAYGKTYEYYPLITKSDYRQNAFRRLLRNYFDNSYEKIVSYIINDKELDDSEAEALRKLIDENQDKMQ